ncbi:hypothetical protein M9458_010517, partial [Cirrhinus mrigala]
DNIDLAVLTPLGICIGNVSFRQSSHALPPRLANQHPALIRRRESRSPCHI